MTCAHTRQTYASLGVAIPSSVDVSVLVPCAEPECPEGTPFDALSVVGEVVPGDGWFADGAKGVSIRKDQTPDGWRWVRYAKEAST